MKNGYIKLWRKTIKSDMYKSLTAVQRDVMMTCLMLANHAPRKWEWRGQVFTCLPGQFVTSLDSLRKKCAKGVTIKMIRTAIKKLEEWGFMASEGASTGRLITIINWEVYQNCHGEEGKEEGKRGANEGQTEGKRGATNKNVKNVKNLKNKEAPSWIPEKEWNDFLNMRAEKGRLVTESVANLLILRLMNLQEAGEDLKEVLNYSTRNQYNDLFPVKNKQDKKGPNRQVVNPAKDDDYDNLTH